MTLQDWKAGHRRHNAEREARISNATKCLKLVCDVVPLGHVVDFGCGIGAWLYAAETLGAGSVLGIEGTWIHEADTIVSKAKIQVADLATDPPFFAKQFDLAMAIEVAEHLPEKSADKFCRSLVSAADRILFSAAVPGQPGIGHINLQPLPYWVSKFWALGYAPIELIRPYIADDKSIYWWLRQNLVMFVAYDKLIRSPNLLRFARPIADFRLNYRPV
jgi:SAM-dependent methyltransferase